MDPVRGERGDTEGVESGENDLLTHPVDITNSYVNIVVHPTWGGGRLWHTTLACWFAALSRVSHSRCVVLPYVVHGVQQLPHGTPCRGR